MKTAEWLKNKRIEHCLTQHQLSNLIGVTNEIIDDIENGKELGNAKVWEKIENYFINSELIKISYNSEDLINELKNDIKEFGENYNCILVYKIVDDNIFFTNYDFIAEEKPFNPEKELLEGEKFIEATLKYALEVFEAQNKTLQ